MLADAECLLIYIFFLVAFYLSGGYDLMWNHVKKKVQPEAIGLLKSWPVIDPLRQGLKPNPQGLSSCCKMRENPTKTPLQWFNICLKISMWAVVKGKAKRSTICPRSRQQLHLHPEGRPPEQLMPHVLVRAPTWWTCLWGNKRVVFLSALTHWQKKVQGVLSFFRSSSETSVACVSLQEDLQRRLVNRKQAHLVRVAFYGLTDSNSISWEPEEDEFLSFGLIEWLIWFVTRVCVLCDILPVQLRFSWRKKTITWSSFTSVLRIKGVRWPGPYTAAIKATLSPSFCRLPVTREVVSGMWSQR